MFNNAATESAEKVIVVEPKIEVNLSHKDFKTLNSAIKPRTRANMKDYNLGTQVDNNEDKNNTVSAKVSDKVSDSKAADGKDEDDLKKLFKDYNNKDFSREKRDNEKNEKFDKYYHKTDKNNLFNPESPSNNNRNNPEPENHGLSNSNNNPNKDNSITGDKPKEPPIKPEEDSTKELLEPDPDKTPLGNDNDPNKPTKHKVRKPDIGGRGT